MFANQLPRVGVLNGKGREEYAIILSFFFIHLCFFVAIQALSASFNSLSEGNGIWPFSFFYGCFFVAILAFSALSASCAL